MVENGSQKSWCPAWLRWLVWAGFGAAWTAALLWPQPPEPEPLQKIPYGTFLAAKGLHVSAYAAWTVLSGWLHLRKRAWLLAMLLLHGIATEVLQSFIPSRTASVGDVALDWLGVGLGLLASWKWWRRKSAPSTSQFV